MYHARFSGTHYEAGLRWGRALALRGKFIARQPTFAVSEERRAFARGCLPAYREYFPEILEEIRGIAEGQGADSDDFATFLFSMYAYGFGHCTCFAYADENSAMLGRNSDFLTSLEGLYMNCLYAVDGSRAFNANTTAFAEVEDGMNECGLAAGLTFVYPEERGFGLNAGMLVRLILEKCATAREALGLLCAVPSAPQHTITVADGSGDIFVAECSPRKISIVRAEEGKRFVVAANNFFSEEMRGHGSPAGFDDWNAAGRYGAAGELLTGRTLSPAEGRGVLADRRLCGYDRRTGADTVWAVLYDTKNGRVFRAEGNPSRRAFAEDDRLFSFAAKKRGGVDRRERSAV